MFYCPRNKQIFFCHKQTILPVIGSHNKNIFLAGTKSNPLLSQPNNSAKDWLEQQQYLLARKQPSALCLNQKMFWVFGWYRKNFLLAKKQPNVLLPQPNNFSNDWLGPQQNFNNWETTKFIIVLAKYIF